MPLVMLGVAFILLLFLIVRLKINAFLALVMTSWAVGMLNGMTAQAALGSVLKGVGDTMGSIVLVIVFGAILGKLIEESGAAHTIANSLIGLFGEKRLQISMILTGFLVGLPMIYNAGFLVLIPLMYTLSATTGLSLLYVGLPVVAALGVTHAYLPPHPGPTTIAMMFHADVNMTLAYGLVIAVPATLLAGPGLSVFFRKVKIFPPKELYKHKVFAPEELPGLGSALFTTTIPVLLMLIGAIVTMTATQENWLTATAKFISDPNVALLIACLVGFYTLGLQRGKNMDAVMKSVTAAASGVSMIILIIAGGGAFKQVLLDCGTGDAIKAVATQAQISPILVGWGTAVLLRIALGSATVAGITAAGIVLPLLPGSGIRPELLVIAVGAGSVACSHFNDVGFWMFKEYFNVSVRQTFQMWTAMESIVSVVGLLGVLALQAFLGPVG